MTHHVVTNATMVMGGISSISSELQFSMAFTPTKLYQKPAERYERSGEAGGTNRESLWRRFWSPV